MVCLKTILAAALAALMLLGVAALGPAAGAGEEWVPLFNGKDLSGWKKFVDPRSKVDPDQIWSVRNGQIRCEGKVFGYLLTEKEYGDYILRVDWRWGDKVFQSRNSGVFLHVSGPDKIWPKGVEAQLMSGHAGDFWLVDDFKLRVDPSRRDPRVGRHYFRMKDHVEKPIGEWNRYEITCKGDTIKLVINGQLVNQASGAEAARGKILLQSEGAEVYFRNIELKHLR
jgi:hypothetical protein